MESPVGAPAFPAGYVNQKRVAGLIACSSIFLAVETIFFVLRFVARRYRSASRGGSWGWDDTFIIPAWIFNIGLCITGLVMATQTNIGRHEEAVIATEGLNGLVSFFKALFSVGFLVYLANTFPKLSILALYHRLFPGKSTRVIINCLAAIVILNCIAGIFIGALQCIPASKVWNKAEPGSCVDLPALYSFSGFPNILIDLSLLILPLPIIHRLQLSRGKKIGILITFLCGGIGLFGSCYRFAFFIHQQENPHIDGVWTGPTGTAWTIVEPGMSFIAACLLTMRPLASTPTFRRLRSSISSLSNGISRQKKDTSDSDYS